MKTKNYLKFAVIACAALTVTFLEPSQAKADTGAAGFGITNAAFAGSGTFTAGNGVADISENDFTTLVYKGSLISSNGFTNTLYFARVDSNGDAETAASFTWLTALTTAQSGGSGSLTNTNTFLFSTNLDRATINAWSGYKLLSNVTVCTGGFITNPVLNAELKRIAK